MIRKEGALRPCFASLSAAICFHAALFFHAALCIHSPSAFAQSPAGFAPRVDASDDFQTQVLLSELDNPTGLALLPTRAKSGPYQLFFAESGAGRVMRVASNKVADVAEVVADFPLGTFGAEPSFRVGPMALAFVSRSRLVVGCKGVEVGSDLLKSYSIPTAGKVLSADDQDHEVGPLTKKIAASIDDLHFGAFATTEKTVYVTTGGG